MQQLGFVQGQLRQLENIKSSVIIESEPNTKLISLLKLYKFSVLNNKKNFLISHTIPSFGLASVEGWFCLKENQTSHSHPLFNNSGSRCFL